MAEDMRHSSRVAISLAALFVIVALVLGWLWPRLHPPRDGVSNGATGQASEQFERQTMELITATGRHVLEIEVARSPEQQALGLMYRTALPENYGMLFPHAVPREAGMWMKNTYLPLDMVFISETGRVHHIVRNTEPHSTEIISSNGPVAAVLELPAGAADRYGLKVGDQVQHRHFTE
jgi:uncharacterized protein